MGRAERRRRTAEVEGAEFGSDRYPWLTWVWAVVVVLAVIGAVLILTGHNEKCPPAMPRAGQTACDPSP